MFPGLDQSYCCNYPHIDFAIVDFVMTAVILAMLKILLIWLTDQNSANARSLCRSCFLEPHSSAHPFWTEFLTVLKRPLKYCHSDKH